MVLPLIGMFFNSASNACNKAELEGMNSCQKNEAGKIRQSKSVPKRALQFPALFGGLWEWNSLCCPFSDWNIFRHSYVKLYDSALFS